jgi:hypothetical protein
MPKFLPNQSWRLNKIAGRPGWIHQQIVKLSIPDIVKEDAIIILDSDVFFIKSFSVSQLLSQSTQRALIRIHPLSESGMQREHMSKSREILNIPPGNTDFHYLAWPVVWYKDLIIQLQEYLSKTNNQHWQYTLLEAGVISEYTLYGLYLEEILKYENLNVITEQLHLGIWDKHDFKRFLSDDFSLHPNTFCIVVQSNLGIDVKEYYQKINNFLK